MINLSDINLRDESLLVQATKNSPNHEDLK